MAGGSSPNATQGVRGTQRIETTGQATKKGAKKGAKKAGFRHVHPRAQDIIRHGTDWKLWVLCDRDPVDKWVDGRVALLGDAAHPTLQYMAQGACMAMEDSVCLADEMDAYRGDIEAALESYRQQRLLRTARIVLMSRAVGEHIYHPAGTHAALRNAVMSVKSDDEWYDILAWLYDGPPPKGQQISSPKRAAS